MSGRTLTEQQLGDLALLCRVRNRIDRDYAQPLDVGALARGAQMLAGRFSCQFSLALPPDPVQILA